MNFSSMEYFSILAQERSFTRAAERLHITQQSLSAHIAAMEKELGCRLIVRHVPLELTYAGEVMMRYASGFQQSYADMQHEFRDISQDLTGVLRIGAASARGQILLPEAIAAFQTRWPGVRVELTAGSNGALVEALLKKKLDLAIADFPESLPGIRVREFCREEPVLVMEKHFLASVCGPEAERCADRLRAGDFSVLRDIPLVIGSAEDIDGRIARAILKRSGVEAPVIRVVSHNVGMLLRLTLHGAGACFCPKNIVQKSLTMQERSSLLTFGLGSDAAYAIRFGYPAQSYLWSAVERFMACVESCAG